VGKVNLNGQVEIFTKDSTKMMKEKVTVRWFGQTEVDI
jgi:hypothetical protein